MNEKCKTIKHLERHYSVRHPVATDANSNVTNQIKVEIQFLSETSPICVCRASTGRQQSEHFHHLKVEVSSAVRIHKIILWNIVRSSPYSEILKQDTQGLNIRKMLINQGHYVSEALRIQCEHKG